MTRLIVSLVGIPLVLWTVWSGFPILTILVGLCSLWALWEFYGLARMAGHETHPLIGSLWTIIFIANGQVSTQTGNFVLYILGVGLMITLVYIWILSRQINSHLIKNWIVTSAGPIYVGFLASHALMLRETAENNYDGRDWLLYAIIITFAVDTAAFLIGKSMGRIPLLARISPKKTLEGAVAGLLAGVSASMAISRGLTLGIPVPHQVALGLLLGIVAQIGDLVESALKRHGGAKDSSSIIPGHGGLLDRMDSLLATIPVTYYLGAFIM